MDFMDAMQKTANKEKTLTENYAVAYRTSGKELLDFNFKISQFRDASDMEIAKQYAKCFFEDKITAVKYLFYLGDVRKGIGERRSFRICFDWLIDNRPEVALALLEYIPEYTRWDNLTRLVKKPTVEDEVVRIVESQLWNDYDVVDKGNGDPISLCAKWMPSVNASSKSTRELGKYWTKKLQLTSKSYRKMLSKLRAYLDVVEVKMCKKKWGDINYETVPSRANLIYNNAFLRNDTERRKAYLKSLESGEKKINASVLQPHEIVRKYGILLSKFFMGRYDKDEIPPVDGTLEELWKALPQLFAEKTLVVRDGSGSMIWTNDPNGVRPIDVSTALAIYAAEHNSGGWKDKFVTFSARPEIVDISNCDSLHDKLVLMDSKDDCSNTNIYATMRLIVETAHEEHIPQEDMPGMVLILSDMQFDGTLFNLDNALFESIQEEFETFGYKLPKICFWNLTNRRSSTIPLQENELGLILCSGFSIQIMNLFKSGKTDPYEVLLDTLNTERYQPIEEAVCKIL